MVEKNNRKYTHLLDACSVIQIRESQKVNLVHLDIAYSVGETWVRATENATYRQTESTFWETIY